MVVADSGTTTHHGTITGEITHHTRFRQRNQTDDKARKTINNYIIMESTTLWTIYVPLLICGVLTLVLPWVFKRYYTILIGYVFLLVFLTTVLTYGGWLDNYQEEHRLAELGFKWEGGTYDNMFADVSPEDMEEAQAIFKSQMGIGWQAKVMVGCISSGVPMSIVYWLMVLCHWLVLKYKKKKTQINESEVGEYSR